MEKADIKKSKWSKIYEYAIKKWLTPWYIKKWKFWFLDLEVYKVINDEIKKTIKISVYEYSNIKDIKVSFFTEIDKIIDELV